MGSQSLWGRWMAAWTFSALVAAVVFRTCRRSGFRRLESATLAAAFFPSPLGYAMSSQNSCVYVFDFFIPISLYLAHRAWRRIPFPLQIGALMLFLSAGVLPVFSASARAEAFDALSNLVNASRLAGCLALMLFLSDKRKFAPIDRGAVLRGFSVLSIVLFAAMVLNGTELLKSDVFTAMQASAAAKPEASMLNLEKRFLALGLFRGSIGILGSLGVFAFLVRIRERRRSLLAPLGAICGLVSIVLIGSKTSLIATGILFAVWTIRKFVLRPSKRLVAIVVIAAAVSGTFMAGLYAEESIRKLVPELMLDLLGLGAQVVTPTLDARATRWQDTLDMVLDDPATLLGFGSSEKVEYNVSYFHDEYLSVLALAGALGEVCYLCGLFFLWKGINSGRAETTIVEFARLAFLSGLINGVSVANFQPALLFIGCVAPCCAAYGLAAGYRSGSAATATSRVLELNYDEDFHNHPYLQ
jgi:hypothetical protein